MKFTVLKVLDKIWELYKLPRDRERFDRYLYLLKGGNKNDMLLPIAGFNPMGKELALNRLEHLIALKAEELVNDCLQQINLELGDISDRTIQVALNLVDDVEGSWSNHAVTDYKNKFEFDGLITRDFCTPIFYTSESSVSEEDIIQRTKEYVFRTVYWIEKEKPTTLHNCFEQEIFVQTASGNSSVKSDSIDRELLKDYYEQHKNSEDYHLILNFFYGDEATKDLNYPSFGIPQNAGFEYVKYVAERRKGELQN